MAKRKNRPTRADRTGRKRPPSVDPHEESAVLAEYKDELAEDSMAQSDQRDAANEDMRFVHVEGGMWEDAFSDEFAERVKLEMDVISGYLQSFIGEWNQNRVGVEFKPADNAATDDDAKLLNGIYRADFMDYFGKDATDNAVDEAATCGVAAMKLTTVLENPDDPTDESQRICWKSINNAYDTVIWDSSAKGMIKEDARYCNVLDQYTKRSFEREYPDAKPVSAIDPSRFHSSDSNRWTPHDTIFISSRYEIHRVPDPQHIYNNLVSGEVEAYSEEDHEEIRDELHADETRVFVKVREMTRQIVKKTVYSGSEILEPERRIIGRYIPIIPFYGYRVFVDGAEWYRGLIRKLKDAQRLWNIEISQVAENAATGGQEVPIFDPAQMEAPGIAEVWADKNNSAYLLASALRDPDGNIIQHGPIGYSRPPAVDPSAAQLMDIVPRYIEQVTGGPPKEAFTKELSGKALNILVKRGNMNTQVVNDNIERSIAWSGSIYASMASEVYSDTRIIETISKDGTRTESHLGREVIDEKTGRLVPINVLGGKRFKAYPDTGPQYETLREQTVEDIKGTLETIVGVDEAKVYLPVLLSVLFKNINGVGLDELKQFNRNMMLENGLAKPETPEEEAFVKQASEPKENAQEELTKAATAQQLAEAKNLEASAGQKDADAEKKRAETQKILSEIGRDAIINFLQGQDQSNGALVN